MEIKSISRLKFRHHDEVFTGATLEDARALAVNYVATEMWYKNPSEECDGSNPLGHSLYGEPTVVKYSLEGDEENAHIILAIGAKTNDTNRPENNKFCFIDIDKTEQEIADLAEEIEKAIKSLTLVVFDTDTLDLHTEKTEIGTFLSGDVKTAKFHVFDDETKYNNLMVASDDESTGPEGLFIYVDLEYDEEAESFTFVVTNADGTLKKQEVKLPNNYLVGGMYSVQDQSLHLKMKNGDDIVIDCTKLIMEWDVEGESSKTPIVLTREEVGPGYDGDEYHHLQPWQDVLRADIRIGGNVDNNILEKSLDGRYLYVDGVATKIRYYYGGSATTVADTLNELKDIKVSPDHTNIIQNRSDGFFANTQLDFISEENQLVFRTTNWSGGTTQKTIQLNTVDIPITDIYYNPATEELIIKWKNDKGEIKTIKIDISQMIDEWEVLNPGHNVTLQKVHKTSGKDQLSADANIYDGENNILVDRDHSLYVKGTADNIKYQDTTVESALDSLGQKIDTETARAEAAEQALDDKIDDETARAREAEADLHAEIEAVSADSIASLKHVINEDNSIVVVERDGSDGKEAVVNVKLSEQDSNNSIRLKSDGLYNFVDLEYDSETNKLKLIKSIFSADTTVEKEIKLDTISFIDEIKYDPETETLTIVYYSGTEKKTVEINLGQILQEWEVYNDADSAVKLNRERVIDGKDKLSGVVVITSAHTDNVLENSHGALYVPANTDVTRALSGAIDTEKTRAEAADAELGNRIESEERRAILAEGALSSYTVVKVNEEQTRAMTAEGDLRTAIVSETERANAADAILSGNIQTVAEAVVTERERAREAEESLQNNIDDSKVQFKDTTSIDFESEPPTVGVGSVITAEVKLQEGDNMIKLGQGLYATAHLSYDTGTNKIKLTTTAGEEEYQLAGATVIDNLVYDPVNKSLVITYHDGNGGVHTVSFPVSELFNDWDTNNPSENSAVELTKTPSVQPGGEDKLSGRVLLANLDDNAVKIINNGLYVSSSAMTEAQEVAKCVKNEIKVLEKAVIGHPVGEECGSGYTYEPNTMATYINTANSFNNADAILDANLKRVEDKIDSSSGETVCVDTKANKLYELLMGIGSSMIGCGENTQYTPDLGSCVISAATSFMEADRMLGDQICEILEMWQSGMTCTSISNWIDDGANKRLEVNVRPSHGNTARQTDEELYVTGFTGDYIDPTRTEFTDTNALRIVCLQEGESGSTPDVKSLQNGVYLSNVWDCGLYYGPSDSEAKSKARAAGYIVDPYSTDESPGASNYDYNNNVRQ